MKRLIALMFLLSLWACNDVTQPPNITNNDIPKELISKIYPVKYYRGSTPRQNTCGDYVFPNLFITFKDKHHVSLTATNHYTCNSGDGFNFPTVCPLDFHTVQYSVVVDSTYDDYFGATYAIGNKSPMVIMAGDFEIKIDAIFFFPQLYPQIQMSIWDDSTWTVTQAESSITQDHMKDCHW